MFKLVKGKHYLIRQQYQSGADRRDDLMVVKFLRKAAEHEREAWATGPMADGMMGQWIKDESVFCYFEPDDVVSSIVVE